MAKTSPGGSGALPSSAADSTVTIIYCTILSYTIHYELLSATWSILVAFGGCEVMPERAVLLLGRRHGLAHATLALLGMSGARRRAASPICSRRSQFQVSVFDLSKPIRRIAFASWNPCEFHAVLGPRPYLDIIDVVCKSCVLSCEISECTRLLQNLHPC